MTDAIDNKDTSLPGAAFRNKYVFQSEPGIIHSILDGYRVYPVAGEYNEGDSKSAIVNALLYLLVRGIGREKAIARWLMFLQRYPQKLQGIPSDHLLAIKFSDCQEKLLKQCTHLVAILLMMGSVLSVSSARCMYDKHEKDVLEPLESEVRRLQSFKWNAKSKKYESSVCKAEAASDKYTRKSLRKYGVSLWTEEQQHRRDMARTAKLSNAMPNAPSRPSLVRYNRRPELTRRIKYARTKE